jgi:hypothetical protein
MSTADLFLDPDRVNELEPVEGDEHQRVMLSPHAVPRMISVTVKNGGVFSIRFQYSGEEDSAPVEALDALDNPVVAVRPSAITQKVLELLFDPPVQPEQLEGLPGRFEARSKTIAGKAKRLSYLMTANILTEWGIDLARRSIQHSASRQRNRGA